jgi:homoserine dehydrogenase
MKKIKIGLAGLGNVGRGVYEILQKDKDLLTQRSQAQFEVVAVSARSKKDFIDAQIKFYENAIDLANDANVDVVIEVIGGDKVAKELLEASLKNNKKFVTANKQLLAEQGFSIAQLLEKTNSSIGFEAAVAGGIPIIKQFKEGLAANEIQEFYAILNGTCNFILTKMQNEKLDFALALKQAQDLGYAEADPTFDIKGIDTAHKLVLLSSIASATKPAFAQLHVEGIDEVTIDDINLADALGYKIKLLATYKKLPEGLQQTVYPALISVKEKIAQVDDSFNAVMVKAENADCNFIVGRGAGKLPTASAIVADLVDIALNRSSFLFNVKSEQLAEANIINISQREGKYFLRLLINKEAAQKTDLAKAIFGEKIKAEKAQFLDRGDEVLCGFVTDSQKEETVLEAIKNFDSDLVKSAKFLRVEETGF